MSFVAYLTKIRLEHALELLRTTEDKTYIIASRVGYMEPNYFSYVFKKQYGIPRQNTGQKCAKRRKIQIKVKRVISL